MQYPYSSHFPHFFIFNPVVIGFLCFHCKFGLGKFQSLFVRHSVLFSFAPPSPRRAIFDNSLYYPVLYDATPLSVHPISLTTSACHLPRARSSLTLFLLALPLFFQFCSPTSRVVSSLVSPGPSAPPSGLSLPQLVLLWCSFSPTACRPTCLRSSPLSDAVDNRMPASNLL